MTTTIAVIVDTSVICSLALLICRLLQRRTAALRHVILAAALAAAATVPLLEAVLPRWEIALLPETSQPISSGATLSGDLAVAGAGIGVTAIADATRGTP